LAPRERDGRKRNVIAALAVLSRTTRAISLDNMIALENSSSFYSFVYIGPFAGIDSSLEKSRLYVMD